MKGALGLRLFLIALRAPFVVEFNIAFRYLKKEVFGKMARIINDDCIMCGSCEAECPESAISEGDPMYVIDPAKCSDCGTCEEACPNEAIKPV